MDQEIIVAGLALVGSLSGTYFANRRATALIAYRLEQLEKNASLTVEKCELRSFDGNPVIYKFAEHERDYAAACRRIEELEKGA